MSISLVKISLLFILGMGFFTLAWADTVYLASGEKVEGKIYREGGINVYLIADTEIGLVSHAVSQNEIEKIEYEKDPQETGSNEQTEELVKRYREFQKAYRAANKSFDNKEYYDAMELYRQAIELNPNYPQVHYNLGVVYVNLGYSSNAKTCFQDAERLAKLIRNPSEKEQELIANIKNALQSLE